MPTTSRDQESLSPEHPHTLLPEDEAVVHRRIRIRTIINVHHLFRGPVLLGQIGILVGAVLVWAAASAAGLLDAAILPAPQTIGAQLLGMALEGAFWANLGATLKDAFFGLCIAVLVGVPLGLVVGILPAVERSTRQVFDIGRAFPSIALLPVLVLLFGATSTMKIIVIVMACVFPVFLQSLYGARHMEPGIQDIARGFRVPPVLYFRKIVIPNAMPFIATGIRIATTMSILVAISVELVSLTPGMGQAITLARTSGAAAQAYAYVCVAAVLGIVVNLALDRVELRVLHWRLRSASE